jgi:hypothetical protein
MVEEGWTMPRLLEMMITIDGHLLGRCEGQHVLDDLEIQEDLADPSASNGRGLKLLPALRRGFENKRAAVAVLPRLQPLGYQCGTNGSNAKRRNIAPLTCFGKCLHRPTRFCCNAHSNCSEGQPARWTSRHHRPMRLNRPATLCHAQPNRLIRFKRRATKVRNSLAEFERLPDTPGHAAG